MVKFKILAIPWFSLNFQLFMTEGEEPRSGAEANFGLRHPAGMMPCKPKSGTFSLREKSGSSPRAPADLSRREFPEGKVVIWRVHAANFSSRLALLWIKKIGYRKFQTSANSHEIRCKHHLVAGLFVCEKFLLAGRRKRRGVNAAASTLRRQRCGVVRHTDLSKQPIKNHFLITSQPTNLRRTSGTVTLPSAF